MITSENTKTIYDLVQNAGREYGDKIFLRYEKDEIVHEKSYRVLAKDCNSVSAWTEEKKQELGHTLHAALLGRCSYTYLVSLLGCASEGAITIPLDVQLSKEGLEDNLKRSDADILFYDWEFQSQVEIIKEKCHNIKYFICLQSIKHIKCVADILNQYRERTISFEVKPKDCAMIIFTSGTTGRGKGVMLSHENLIDNTFCTTESELQEREVCLNLLPIHHIFCLNGDVFLVMRYGNCLCIGSGLAKMLYDIQLFQPTMVRLVPMMAKMLYNKIAIALEQNPALSKEQVKEQVLGKRLHRIISGGGYLVEELAENFAKLGITIGQGYGMSECSPKISTPDYTRADKRSSVGRIVGGCKVRIEDGEIQVKSPSVMMGYYKEPDKTAEAITEDGWLRTGDLGYVDEENFLYLTGRKKNLIILSNGENVSPEEIENKFDGELLISDILVYGKDASIAAEVYPNYEYAAANQVSDVEGEVQKIIQKHNKELPSYKKIARCSVRNTPFEKTSSKKIIRERYFEQKQEEEERAKTIRKPENEMQKKIYEMVAALIGNQLFGTDSNFYDSGLDSLGSMMLVEEVHTKLGKEITFHDLLENNTVLKLEQYLLKEKEKTDIDLSKREVYPLTGMQKYFAYIIKGNTTGNLPFTFHLDDSIDLGRLKSAIEDTIEAHPGLKGNIHFDTNAYKLFRNDERKIDIPIIKLTEKEWEKKLKELLVPYAYTVEDNLFHISLFQTESAKYMFFDVSHIMGDGITMNILFEDINKRYMGEEIEKETYTFYEYVLEEQNREQAGIRQKDTEYVDGLMKNAKLTRSILNKKEKEDYTDGTNAVICQRFDRLVRKKILYFCRQNGVSENVVFLTAFNYCMSLFGDEKDVFSNSIHGGRTNSRWTRLAGPLFLTYYCRYVQVPHERVLELLKKTAHQIMNTMQCFVACPREGEMFFQFQGDIIDINKIGDAKAQRIRLQLDSLPFHMQVMTDENGYYTELRYWKNRFDREQLEVFLVCYESVIAAMLEERSVRRLKRHMPETVYPKHFYIKAEDLNREAGYEMLSHTIRDEKVKVYILDEGYYKKPYGAWGPLFVMNHKPDYYEEEIENPYGAGMLYNTKKIARILPDGSVDFLEKGGRTVLTDGIHGRRYYDLADIEKTLCEYDGIEESEAYLCYDKQMNEMKLIANIRSDEKVEEENLKAFVEQRCSKMMVPAEIKYME